MRRIIKIKEGWKFTDQHQKRIAVTIPHTWNAKDGQDGGNDYWRGTNVYDVNFAKPVFQAEEEVVYLQFHGVNASAKVFLNGEMVCTHEGGYATFRTNITKYLKEQNELKV